jgi:GNAT superfamily N-acetyltransferase
VGPDVQVKPSRYGGPVAAALIAAAQADMAERYGGGDETPVGALDFDPPRGTFLVAWIGETPVGCGGWRTLPTDGQVAEVKRMYVHPKWRGRGVGSAILQALEESARRERKRRIILETGVRQPEAIALYRKQGYAQIPNFGYYADHAGSMSFGRDL